MGTDVLTKHNPSGVNTVTNLLKQFPGKEHQVYIQICKKCGVNPVGPPSLDDLEDVKVKPLQGNSNEEKVDCPRVTDWLIENNFAKYVYHFQTMSWEDFSTISNEGRLIELGVLPKEAKILLSAISKARESDGTLDKSAGKIQNKTDFDIGENCYTKVLALNSKDREKWLNAKVTNINEDGSFDIFVYNAKAFNVPPEAVNVPRDMLKKISEDVNIAVPLKRKSQKRPQFLSGDRVKVFGLRSHTSYNGLCGTVLLYVASERRYQVRLDTNDVIAIKQRNVGPVDVDKNAVKAPVVPDEGNIQKNSNVAEKDVDNRLSTLMAKLMKDNPNTDPGKLGEFAAGYLLARQKLSGNNMIEGY